MMINFQNCLVPQGANAIVLSIKPKYAELILAGTKTVELRRSWAAEKIDVILIYASSPICRLVGIVKVKDIRKLAPATLWTHCSQNGGGLTRQELLQYFEGKEKGYVIFLDDAKRFSKPIEPQTIIENFSAPQSFRYLTPPEIRKLETKLRTKKKTT
ncbi:MAG: ASCH domain-containing protein [Herminiimonas sp.]|uniref:ASCH domain-containing protein n=1 Tax=Herminiimonas sp. TaxID=1926289 RepID=UPI00271800D6|nr:ASCH domain-containing protein [Herminiimonas sp.]MDO9420247.1 ASCH domain-containing protein [Herminiimonas sp.]